MSRVPVNVLTLPMEQRALMALRSAVRKAIAERRKLGLPIYIWSNGRVVDISRRTARKSGRPRLRRDSKARPSQRNSK